MTSTYRVTIEDPNDPEAVQILIMNENEVRDTYPHWGGKPVLTSREGARVSIEPATYINPRVEALMNDMRTAHASGQHADGMPRGICAACDFGPGN